ncbi:MAG TPA: hypothetical protein VGR53_09930 [Nitrososphaerales archaeon]|nr:hypothetical protein [Nitrososphaerales archaeon]
MERQNLYFMSLGALLMLSTVGLSIIGAYTLDVYVSLFTISYFVASTIFRPRRRMFDFVGLALFGAFAFIVALRILAILTP